MTRHPSSKAAPRDSARFAVSADEVRRFLAHAVSRGVAVDGVLASAGLREADLLGAEARIPQTACHAVIAELADRTGDDDLGLHVAEQLDLEVLGVVGHLAAHSATLGAAFDRICAFSRLLHESSRVELERRGGEAVVYPGSRGQLRANPRHLAEFAALAMVRLARRVTGKPVTPKLATFRHPAPAQTAEHLRLFGVTPQFGQPESVLLFDGATLALPIGTTGALPSFLDAHAADVRARMPQDDSLAAEVERAVGAAMARGVPDGEAVAAPLGLTARNLQRRLAEQDTTFAVILDRVRRAFAERHLADDRLSLAEIGFMVGFAEPGNFLRAFRRWTGMTPSAYRAARTGHAAPAADDDAADDADDAAD